jgi:hypothetical protein
VFSKEPTAKEIRAFKAGRSSSAKTAKAYADKKNNPSPFRVAKTAQAKARKSR